MEFRILGTLEVVDGGFAIDVGTAAKKALLAILLLHPNQVVSVDRLVDDLWSDDPPPGARGTLQTYVRALRKAIEPEARAGSYRLLVTHPPGYVLQLDGPEQLDAARFEAQASRGHALLERGDFAASASVLREALALWRGPALADFVYQSFAQPEATRLEEARLAVLEDRLTTDLGTGRHGELVGELEALVARHPLREGFWRQLMLALYRGGRPAEALRAYRRLRDELGELGLEPGAELQRLETAMVRQEDWLAAPPRIVSAETAPVGAAPSAEQPAAGRSNNLPVPISTFVGRGFERREVRKLIERERLVTLTGSGGCGKTRLALAVATDIVDTFTGGVWFADLAPVADENLLPQVIAVAMGLREEPGRPLVDTLIDSLHPNAALVVFDNCEHLIDAAARLGDLLLRSCPELRILATSREILGIPGEAIFRVPSLSLPPGTAPTTDLLDYEAVRLFMDRAVAAQPKLALEPDTAAAVASICIRLDGIPLAIELAAARTAVLSPRQIASRLDDRFRLLISGNRAALPRHRTLLAALEWSYRSLDPAEQALLQRLSVFAGRFTVDAAEAVGAGNAVEADDVLAVLARLADKSLVVVEVEEGEGRYRLLETIRAYAADQLRASGDEEPSRERHLRYFIDLAYEAEAAFDGPAQAEWLDRLERAHADLQGALSWATEHERGDAALRLATALLRFWEAGGYWGEGRRSLEAALEHAPAAPAALLAKARWQAGWLALHQDDYRTARPHIEAALELFRELGDVAGTARAVNLVGGLGLNADDLPAAAGRFEEALALYRQAGDQAGTARALNNLGIVARRQGDHATAAARYEEALAVFRELADPVGIGNCLNNLGLVRFSQGDYQAARTLIEEALALCAPGDRQQRAGRLESLGRVASGAGDAELARCCYRESVALSRELGSMELIAFSLEGLAWVAATHGHNRRAARLRGAASALRDATGCPVPAVERPRYERDVAVLRSALGDAAFDAAWSEGQRMSIEEAIHDAADSGSDDDPPDETSTAPDGRIGPSDGKDGNATVDTAPGAERGGARPHRSAAGPKRRLAGSAG